MDPSLYLDRDTWVHHLDPRTKIFLLLGMFALPFVFLNPLYELAVLALVLFFGYLAQSLANLRRIWFILLTILIVTPILWSIVGSGRTPLFLFVEREALLYGLSAAQRIVITVIAGMIFVTTVRSTNVFSMALESKGFGARPERTYFLRTAMSGRDALVIVGFVALLAGCIALRLAGYGGLEGFSR